MQSCIQLHTLNIDWQHYIIAQKVVHSKQKLLLFVKIWI